ncbi:MAG TPA: tRNA (adenosine(37)-N6)-threonylcarbamoyltransferase complex ATPase subunit type 1 TsaE [Methylovirgula sp.]
MAAPAQRAPARQAQWRIELPDEAATVALAARVASWIKSGDLLTLSGHLGAGKTTFARALIRHLMRDPVLEVPSPTFTLMQFYEGGSYPVVHADLYRIAQPDELAELGWEEAADGALVIVEWPERAGPYLLTDRLDIAFTIDTAHDADHRTATLAGIGSFAPRLALVHAIHDILGEAGWSAAARLPMQGDASTRAYERLQKPNGETAILMISPPRPDGPALRSGKSYSELAHLAENISAFIAIDEGLRAHGLSTPEIYAFDTEVGVAVLEDFGAEGVVGEDGIIFERYAEAVAALAHMHGLSLPQSLPITRDQIHRIPSYDVEALVIEVELLLDWYAPHVAHVTLTSGVKATFSNLWRHVLRDVVNGASTWTLRDYHSPNLLWLPQRSGIARVGIIDFQDCVIGHPAYDVASLLQDARTSVPDGSELRLLGHYAQLRRSTAAPFDMAGFAGAYAVLGAQRATKILGIFARLDKRDRKPHYLAHLPRIERYLAKDLAHPLLSELRGWYETHLPSLLSPDGAPSP